MLKFKLSLLSLALISAIPSAFAGALPSGFESIHGGATMSSSGNYMGITSNNKNNVIAWKDFSIGSGNTVLFDNQNYLNIVKGSAVSKIAGTLCSTGNIVIVNPNGIHLEKGGVFDVTKNLTLSTSKILDENIEDFKRSGSFTPQNSGMGRVILAGNTEAEFIEINASQIIIRNIEDLKNQKGEVLTNKSAETIKLTSSTNRIDIGGETSVDLVNDYGFSNLKGLYSHLGQTAISTAEEFLAIDNDLSAEYFLTNDIELNLNAPLGGELGFNGLLDGAFNKISYTINYQKNSGSELNLGLFNQIYDGTVQNLLIDASKITLNTTDTLANIGALAGSIIGSTIKNVEIKNFSIDSMDSNLDAYNIGALAGKLKAKGSNLSTLDNVLSSFSSETENALKTQKGSIGSMLGLSVNDINLNNTVLGQSTSALNTIGSNQGSTIISQSIDTTPTDLLKTDAGFTLKAFYNPFFVESFEYDYDENKSYNYKDLVNNQGFDIDALVNITSDSADSVKDAGTYEYQLSNQEDRERNFYFVATSDTASGVGIIKINGDSTEIPEPEVPENPDPELPEIPDSGDNNNTLEPIQPTLPKTLTRKALELKDEVAPCRICHSLTNPLLKKDKLRQMPRLERLQISIKNNEFMDKIRNAQL